MKARRGRRVFLILFSFRRRRLSEIVAQEDAHRHGLAVARRGAEVHLPYSRDDRVVESESGPADYLDATDLAVRADLDRGVNGRLGLRARCRFGVGGSQATVRRRLAQILVRLRALVRREVYESFRHVVRRGAEALALLSLERLDNAVGVARRVARVERVEQRGFGLFGVVCLGRGAIPEDEPTRARADDEDGGVRLEVDGARGRRA